MGPSFGQWLTYDHIPPEMRAAMISTEDRRFRSHIGIDPIGIGRALASAFASGHRVRATSTITQQLARNIFLTNNRSFVRKIKEAHPGDGARAEVQQGPDPRALPQPRLFRRRRLWDRRGVAQVLRPWRRPSEPWRSGDHRRPGQGAVQLFAVGRRRGRALALGRGAADDGPERLHHRRDCGRGRSRRRSASSRPPARTAFAISPTGRCRSSTR